MQRASTASTMTRRDPRMGCRNDLVCALSTMLDERVQVGLCTLQSSRSIVVYINRPVLPDTRGVRIDAYYERFAACVGTGVTVVASTVQLQSARRGRGRNIAETVWGSYGAPTRAEIQRADAVVTFSEQCKYGRGTERRIHEPQRSHKCHTGGGKAGERYGGPTRAFAPGAESRRHGGGV